MFYQIRIQGGGLGGLDTTGLRTYLYPAKAKLMTEAFAGFQVGGGCPTKC